MGKIRRARGALVKEQSMNAFSNSINDANNSNFFFFGHEKEFWELPEKCLYFYVNGFWERVEVTLGRRFPMSNEQRLKG